MIGKYNNTLFGGIIMRGFRDIRRTSDVAEKFPAPAPASIYTPINTEEDAIAFFLMNPDLELPDDSGD